MTIPKEPSPLSVFISHRRECGDHDFARLLSEKLKQSNILVLGDDLEAEDERPSDWDKQVFDAIQESRVVIPILSTQYLTSSTARGELLLALEENKPVLPVLSEKCEIPKALQNTPYIDATAWTPGDDAYLSRIVSEISSHIYSQPSCPGTLRKMEVSWADRTLAINEYGLLNVTDYSPKLQPNRTVQPFVAGFSGMYSLTSSFQPLLTRPVPEADREPHTALASTGAAVRQYFMAAFDTLKEEIAEDE